jgi:hypothetical protein
MRVEARMVVPKLSRQRIGGDEGVAYNSARRNLIFSTYRCNVAIFDLGTRLSNHLQPQETRLEPK